MQAATVTESTDYALRSAVEAEENRSLQAALELSMMNLSHLSTTTSTLYTLAGDSSLEQDSATDVTLKKITYKSNNVTECVPVPSSEHVAEIVGRQGCKIKALRAKTNTYIKTPVRGEDPVFVITGRPDDVGAAKREIQAAAEHFTQIRAARKNASCSPTSPAFATFAPNGQEEHVTIQVRVPYRVVGLVVGPKGSTIKRIQQNTNTYIVTPSRDKEPCFEVTGTKENVEKAKEEIESYIAMRTGGVISEDGVLDIPSAANGNEAPTSRNNPPSPNLGVSVFARSKSFQYPNQSMVGQLYLSQTLSDTPLQSSWPDSQKFSPPIMNSMFLPSSGAPVQPSVNNTLSSSSPIPIVRSLSMPGENVYNFRTMRDALPEAIDSDTSSGSPGSSGSDGLAYVSPKTQQSKSMANCAECKEEKITAALIPCGHHLFCCSCAQQLRERKGKCPICQCTVTNMLRIFQD